MFPCLYRFQCLSIFLMFVCFSFLYLVSLWSVVSYPATFLLSWNFFRCCFLYCWNWFNLFFFIYKLKENLSHLYSDLIPSNQVSKAKQSAAGFRKISNNQKIIVSKTYRSQKPATPPTSASKWYQTKTTSAAAS